MGLTRPRAAQIYDIDYKQSVRVLTTSNITLSGSAPLVVDGVTLSLDDRILVTGQSTASQNGVYRVSVTGTGSNGTWVRTSDTNESGELLSGTVIMVTEGTSYADTSWKLTTNNPITIGSTSLTFEINTGNAFGTITANSTSIVANSATGTVTFAAGDNISITGNNTSKTVTFAATSTVSSVAIANGTSNVTVVSSGGNVTVGTNGSERIRIDSSGNVGIGTSNTPSNNDTVTPKLVVNGAGVAGSMQIVRNTTVGAGGAILELTATRGSDVNSYTILQNGDGVGAIKFGGADGDQFVAAGQIVCQVDGTPGDNDMPGRLIFGTTADGESAPTERMRIDSSGNVGIGTSSPSQKLEVNGNAIIGNLLSSSLTIRNDGTFASGGGGGTALNVSFGGVNIARIANTGTGQRDGIFSLLDENVVKVSIAANSSRGGDTYFNSGGNVGIGTTSPGYKLDVQATGAVSLASFRSTAAGTGNYGQIEVGNDTDSDLVILRSLSSTYTTSGINVANGGLLRGGGAGGLSIGATNGSATIRFYTAGTAAGNERMRVTSDGELCVGKTTAATNTAGCMLGSGSANFVANVSAASGDGPFAQFANINASIANGYRYISFRVNAAGTEVGSISTNGSSSTSYTTSSDYRLKEDVQAMQGALATIAKLKPVTFKWKADGSRGQGFIAHELQSVVPDCVTGEKDRVDNEGNIVPQGVDTSFLVATLTAAIQELKAENDALKARLDAANL